MKLVYSKIKLIILLFTFTGINVGYGQNSDVAFKMVYPQTKTLTISESFNGSGIIYPFKQGEPMFALGINAKFQLHGFKSFLRVILVANDGGEFLVLESNYMLNRTDEISVSNYGEETSLLNGIVADHLKIEMENASVFIESISLNTNVTYKTNDGDFKKLWKAQKNKQDSVKIIKITEQNKINGYSWVAGKTRLSELTYSKKKKIFGDPLPNLMCFEYYTGGVFDLRDPERTKSVSIMQSLVIPAFDWRNRHGKDWITPVQDQLPRTETCAIFAATAATEALINLYYNQLLDINLAEQKPMKCSLWGRSYVLDYYTVSGAVLESCAPYDPYDDSTACNEVCPNPTEIFKIGGKKYIHDIYSPPYTEDEFKKMLIKYGPLACLDTTGLAHEMLLVGYYTDSNGSTVWIFKNSYLREPFRVIYDFDVFMGPYAALPPVTCVYNTYTNDDIVCEDNDGDGYYNWGIGPKPSTCNCPNEEDGDDSNANLGPINEYGYCATLVRNTQTWQSTYNEYNEYADVIVKSGGNLTLNGATVNMANNSTFIVEVGATLNFTQGVIQ